MTASATMQSCIAIPTARSGLSKSYSKSNTLVSFPCKRAMTVRCQAEDKQTPDQEQTSTSGPSSSPSTPTPTPVQTKVAAKASTKFGDLLAFSGSAPERINGRLAMLGFVAALGAELASGSDLSSQLMNGGVPSFVIAATLFTAASLIPLFKGISVQSKSGGLWTADAEMLNGRFAMLGLVALAFTEFVKGGPLV